MLKCDHKFQSNCIFTCGFLGKFTLLNPDKVTNKCVDNLYKRDSVIMVNPLSWLSLMTKAIKREVS